MLQPGMLLQGRYQVLHQIGQGGFGAVYEAIDQRLHTKVALKHLVLQGDQASRAFEQEAMLLAALRHPALPRVIDHFAADEGQFLVMDFIEGSDLLQMLRERNGSPFLVNQVLPWADRLLDALDYLHHQHPPVVHRDIKPANLKVNQSGDVMLLDFGLAKGTTGNLESALSLRGFTPQYAPLEQIEGSGTEPRSDLYALAATLYHLLTAQPPADVLSRTSAVLHSEPDPLMPPQVLNPLIPFHVSATLVQALALKRNERPSDASMFKGLLHEDPAAQAAAQTLLQQSAVPTFISQPNYVGVAESHSQPVTGDTIMMAKSGQTSNKPTRQSGQTSAGFQWKPWLLPVVVALLMIIGGGMMLTLSGDTSGSEIGRDTTPFPTEMIADSGVAPAQSEPPLPSQAGELPPPSITIVSSFAPVEMSEDARSIREGMRLRLEEANFTVCETLLVSHLELDYVSPEMEAANVQLATLDRATVAYIGPFEPQLVRESLPNLNEAGLLMINPSASAEELTNDDRDVNSDHFYPTGQRSMVRIIPSDSKQMELLAYFAHNVENWSRVGIVVDDTTEAEGLANFFEAAAADYGIGVVARVDVDETTTIEDVLAAFEETGLQAVLYAGYTDETTAEFVNGVREIYPDLPVFGNQELLNSWIDDLDSLNNVFAGYPVPDWATKGDQQAAHYEEVFGYPPDYYSIYGYEAMNFVLDAINRTCLNPIRPAVLESAMTTTDFDGVLGRWSVTGSGDITAHHMQILRPSLDGGFEHKMNLQLDE